MRDVAAGEPPNRPFNIVVANREGEPTLGRLDAPDDGRALRWAAAQGDVQ